MTVLDSNRYFANATVARFVDDVQGGRVDRVVAALRAGQDPNVAGNDGFRPIHFVFAARDPGVAEALLAAGADPNARTAIGNTPLHYAVQAPTADFTRVFLQYKADPNARGASEKPVLVAALDSPVSETVLPMLVAAGADVNVVWAGNPPLQLAIASLEWKSADTLLSLKADATLRNLRGQDAGTTFCRLLQRVQPTPNNRHDIVRVGDALKARGATLACDDKLNQFR